ncbi:MAG TPA: hypothetical protein VKO16_01355, partial [Polyangia bacterium]|nr:hypothetical protein [Polyangia bacterium]
MPVGSKDDGVDDKPLRGLRYCFRRFSAVDHRDVGGDSTPFRIDRHEGALCLFEASTPIRVELTVRAVVRVGRVRKSVLVNMTKLDDSPLRSDERVGEGNGA